jgi:antitoxin component YwqK of YwqJK toxin-antitoxin module
MKLLVLLLLIPGALLAQKLPQVGTSVRIIESDKTIVAEIRAVNSTPGMDPEKIYYWYGSNNIHHTQGGYSGHLLNGTYSEFYLNKNLKEQGTYVKGLKSGAWKTWSENGILKQLFTYDKGAKSGPFYLYDDLGKVMQAGNYEENELNGKIKFYAKDSANVVTYKHGKAITSQPAKSFWRKLNFLRKKHH